MTTQTIHKAIHRAGTRGYANHGWLESRHTFSFAGYYNPDRMHFGALRVLNDDIVAGGMGFGTHPHDNMEIISIPIDGSLEHKDSTGHKEVIKPGEVQIMSAGSGLQHSEYNHSKTEKVNFLQIWVFPKEKNIEPRYDQKYFPDKQMHNRLLTVVSPEGEGELWINQDAWFSMGVLEAGEQVDYALKKSGNGIYLFVIEGSITVEGESLDRRDGMGVINTSTIQILANSDSKVLVMDIPMKF